MTTLPTLNGNFCQIPNSIFEDPTISGDAIAVYACMVRNAYRNLNKKALVDLIRQQTGYGRDKTTNALKELTAAGYVTEITTRNKAGHFDRTSFVLHESPTPAEKSSSTDDPCTDYPCTDYPYTDSQNNNTENIRKEKTDSDDAREVTPARVEQLINQSLEQLAETPESLGCSQAVFDKAVKKLTSKHDGLTTRILANTPTSKGLPKYVHNSVINQLQQDVRPKSHSGKPAKKPANQFCNFSQNNYDFLWLEEQLRAN